MHDSQGQIPRARGRAGTTRMIARAVALFIAVSFAVVGIAGPSSAHHNTISGSVSCKAGGGWTVTWWVVNSEQISEVITASNRTGAVPVGTVLQGSQSRQFTESITTKPTSTVTLTLSTRWSNDVTATNSGSIATSSFSDNCAVKQVSAPVVPVTDACGPGNAAYGTVPAGPWTSVVNPDGSLTVTTQPGYVFPDGQTSITLPTPTDSNTSCVVTPPVVAEPEVLPAAVLVVHAAARHIDKCGSASDLFKVARAEGVRYVANGKTVRQGKWLRSKQRKVTIRAFAADASYALEGKQVWKITFTRKACAQAPEISPNTGS